MSNIHLTQPTNLLKNVPHLVLKADGMYQTTNKGVYTITELVSKFENGYSVPNMVQGKDLELQFNVQELVPYYLILTAVSFFKEVEKVYEVESETFIFYKENLNLDELITTIATKLGGYEGQIRDNFIQHGNYFMYVPVYYVDNEITLNYLLNDENIDTVCNVRSILGNYENIEYNTINNTIRKIPVLTVTLEKDNLLSLGITINNVTTFVDIKDLIAIPYVELKSDEDFTHDYLYKKESYGNHVPHIESIFNIEWLKYVVEEVELVEDFVEDNELDKELEDKQVNVESNKSEQISFVKELSFTNELRKDEFLEEFSILLDTFPNETKKESHLSLDNIEINKFNSNKHVQNLELLDNKVPMEELDETELPKFEKELRQRIISSLNTYLREQGYFTEKEYLSKVNVYMGIHENEENELEYLIITEHQQTGKKYRFKVKQMLDDLLNYNIHYVFHKYNVEFHLNKVYYL